MENSNQDIQSVLSSAFMLATFSGSMASVSKTDRKATDEMLISKAAQKGSARAIKNIYAGADAEVKAVATVINATRRKHYELTQPYGTESSSSRLLANEMLLAEFVPTMQAAKAEMNAALDALEAVYDQRVAQAKHNLGDMAEDRDYCSFDEFKRQCSLSYEFVPVPSSTDWSRTSMPSNVADMLAKRTRIAAEAHAEAAVKAAITRMIQPLESMLKATSPQDGERARPIYNSVIDNLKAMTRNLKHFNLYNDPAIDAVCAEVEEKLLAFDVKQLKSNEGAKTQVNKATQDVLDKFADMGWAA